MYNYDKVDNLFLKQRNQEFSGQVARYKDKKLDDSRFRSLRLRNGLYNQLHAYMLRVAIPYGVLNSDQLRQLAYIADKYDRGYGHFTTRQNIQFNWINLDDIIAILDDLAKVEMHAIQTSGKVVRNITTDHLAGVTTDEIEDPRPYCEILRQWFTSHPEFSWMSGKLKIAVNASKQDNAAIRFHDVGLELVHNEKGELGFKVYAGGGLGAFPVIAEEIHDFIPAKYLLSYVESVLRVYNISARRDHANKTRIKFLVKALGAEKFKELVDKDWNLIADKEAIAITTAQINDIKSSFTLPIKDVDIAIDNNYNDANYKIWLKNNVQVGKINGYSIANISLSAVGEAPGDITSDQLRILADLADKYSVSEIRSTNKQNLVFPYVKNDLLYELWSDLKSTSLHSPHNNTIADINCCPGADYCSLAKTKSISITKKIQQRLASVNQILDIGKLKLSISGCENSCAHHHIADIGLLGLLKSDKEFYQLTLAGEYRDNAVIGKKIGPSISVDDIVEAIEAIIATYLEHKRSEEDFPQVFKRIGVGAFKEAVYGK